MCKVNFQHATPFEQYLFVLASSDAFSMLFHSGAATICKCHRQLRQAVIEQLC